jgi:hypothetical protein
MQSYTNEILVRARIDDLQHEADQERLARGARTRTSRPWHARGGRIIAIVRRVGGRSARLLRVPDAKGRDRHGAAL